MGDVYINMTQKSNQTSFGNEKAKVGERAGDVLRQIDDNSYVLKAFKSYNIELIDRQDRYESIVKISRDITIESKRIIFLLHHIGLDVCMDKREKTFQEADCRLNILVQKNFKRIAEELRFQDHYLYLKAYTAGFQEFIEALLFYFYLRDNTITTWCEVKKRFSYKIEGDDKPTKLLFPEMEFVLGIEDFTGELMRSCVNSLGVGDTDNCFRICNFVKNIYTKFLSINSCGCKELNRKLFVLKQSLSKMEVVCYNICVRGSEVPKHMLLNVLSAATDENTEDTEGYL